MTHDPKTVSALAKAMCSRRHIHIDSVRTPCDAAVEEGEWVADALLRRGISLRDSRIARDDPAAPDASLSASQALFLSKLERAARAKGPEERISLKARQMLALVRLARGRG